MDETYPGLSTKIDWPGNGATQRNAGEEKIAFSAYVAARALVIAA